MIWQLDLSILSLIVVCAFATIMVKDLLSAAIIFGAYSFLMCLLWTEMGAVDVAFTEASVGAGVSTVLFIAAVHQTSRIVKPRKSGRLLSKVIGLVAALLMGLVLPAIFYTGHRCGRRFAPQLFQFLPFGRLQDFIYRILPQIKMLGIGVKP